MAAKRRTNVSVCSNDSTCSDDDYCPSPPPTKRFRRNESRDVLRSFRQNATSCDENSQGREKKTKCNSKNAIMARENRIKKKMYVNALEGQITSLKGENKKMKMTLTSQIDYIKELENEVAYLKSVLANSKEIGALIGTICNSSSLQVNTSLNKFRNSEKQTIWKYEKHPPIARKTAWSYESEQCNIIDDVEDIPTPSTSVVSSLSPPHRDEAPFSPLNIDVESYFSEDNDFPIVFDDVQLSPLLNNESINKCDEWMNDNNYGETPAANFTYDTSEHNYSSKLATVLPKDDSSNYGICLHITNKKLSLEFCSKCNEKAVANWEAVTP